MSSIYGNKNEDEKWYFVSNWTGNVHHLIVLSNIIWISNHSICENPYPFIALADDVCLMTVQKEFVYSILITLGYLVQDYLAQRYFSGSA